MNVRSILSAAVVAVGLASFAHADITGKVTYEGKAPTPKKINMTAVAQCAAQHPQGVTEETMVVGKNKELANVVVSLKNPPAGGKVPPTPAILDQKGCQYHPHVLPIMIGQEVKVKNSDPFLHNVHGLPEENPGFNFGQNNVDDGRPIPKMKAAEYFRVKCDVHPWMSAHFAVFNHPYFGASKEDGTFTIAGVPDGTYDVIAWHEKLGEQEAKVTVKGGKGELNIVMKPAEEADARPATPEKVLVLSAKGVSSEVCCEEEKVTSPAVAKK
jgi:hypothetical protein